MSPSTVLQGALCSMLAEVCRLAISGGYGLAELDRWWAKAKADAVSKISAQRVDA